MRVEAIAKAPSRVREHAPFAQLAPADRPRSPRLFAVSRKRVEPLRELAIEAFPELLRAGDVVVANDAATLPASLRARVAGRLVELRLMGLPDDAGEADAVLLGSGDHRTPTEHRPPPPALRANAMLRFERSGTDERLEARVRAVGRWGPQHVRLGFVDRGVVWWRKLYALGRPVQYAHVSSELALWDVQTPLAGRPWSMEMPSAGRLLTAGVMAGIRARGAALVTLTHGAGLSATGDPILDAAAPHPERYAIADATTLRIAAARASGGRVIAVGTTVVRALEAAALDGVLRPGPGIATNRISPDTKLRVVDGLVCGFFEPSASHLELLGALLPPKRSAQAYEAAARERATCHEFGDLLAILP